MSTVEVYRHDGERFAAPLMLERGDILTSALLEGFAVGVDALLGDPEE